LTPVDQHYALVDVHLSLRELASHFFFPLMELEGTTLLWSFDEETEGEHLQILERIFGARAVLLEGPRKRKFVKVLMASSKRGCGEVSFDLSERVLRIKVATHRFNESGRDEAGADVTPELVVADGRSEKDYRFDLVKYVWVPDSTPIDVVGQARLYAPRPCLAQYFGMNGTELK
jgi:hypothetical protein